MLISIPFRPFSKHLPAFRQLFALRGRFWVPLDATIVLMFDPRLSFWQSRLHFLALVERPCAFEPMKTNVFRASTKVVYHFFFFFQTKSPLVLQCKQPTLKINSLTIHWDGQFTHSQFTETPASAFCAAFRPRSGTAAAILMG